MTLPSRMSVAVVPPGVARIAAGVEFVDHRGGNQQRAGHHVHPADVAVEEVVARDRLAAQLRVEHQPAGRESAAAQDLEHAERHLLDRDREPVEVPAEAIVAGVGVDRAEDARR